MTFGQKKSEPPLGVPRGDACYTGRNILYYTNNAYHYNTVTPHRIFLPVNLINSLSAVFYQLFKIDAGDET